MKNSKLDINQQLIFITNCEKTQISLLKNLAQNCKFKTTLLTQHFDPHSKINQNYCDIHSEKELNRSTVGISAIVFQSKGSISEDSNGQIHLSDYDLILIDNIIQAYKKNHVHRLIWIYNVPLQYQNKTPYYKSDQLIYKLFKSSGLQVTELRTTDITNSESTVQALEYCLEHEFTLNHVYSIQNILSTKSLQSLNQKNNFPFLFSKLKKIFKKDKFVSLDRIHFPNGYHADSLVFSLIHWLCNIPKYILNVEKKKNYVSIFLPLTHRPLLILEHKYTKSNQAYQIFQIKGGLLVKNQKQEIIEFKEISEENLVIISVSNFETTLPWSIYRIIQIPIQFLILRSFQKWILNLKTNQHHSSAQYRLTS